MKKLLAMIMALAMVLSLAACGGSEGNEGSGDSTIKAACVLGVGGLGDQGYNDLIYAGM